MMIQLITDKFKLWQDGKETVVTVGREQIKVYRGTKEGAEAFINNYPYGITKAQAKTMEVI